jgi:hypothetical protein
MHGCDAQQANDGHAMRPDCAGGRLCSPQAWYAWPGEPHAARYIDQVDVDQANQPTYVFFARQGKCCTKNVFDDFVS